MRLLYVGELWQGGTCLERASVLREHGWDVLQFDVTPYYEGYGRSVSRAMQNRTLWGPHIYRLNRDLRSFADRTGPFDIVWVDKGRWIHPATVKELDAHEDTVLVHYTPDPAFTLHTSRHFRRALPLYDLCVTTKRYELEHYREAGAREVMFAWQGIDQRFVQSEACEAMAGAARTGIVFIGHAEEHYASILTAVGAAHGDLMIWGPGWVDLAAKRAELRSYVKGGPLWGTDYVAGLARGRIGLGLLSKYCPDQFTTRSFEIPGSGALLIAERTEDHQELFDEGREAEFFSTTDELSEKVDFYLRNEEARQRIAELGRRKTLECYQWKHVMAPAIRAVEAMMVPH